MSALDRLRTRIPAINAGLFVSLFFFLPGKVGPAYAVTALMLALSLVEGRFREKWQRLQGDPLFWIFLAFFWVFPLSLLWTEDLAAGYRMVGRYTFFLLSPLYLTVARRELIPYCIAAFLAGCALAEALAYYNWLQLHVFPDWPRGIRVMKNEMDTAPFVDRIMYAPMLAWAGFLALRSALSTQRIAPRIGYLVLAAATAGNLVLSGGRTGQLAFLVLVAVLIFQRFARRPLLAGLLSVLAVGGLLGGGYAGSDYFRERVDAAIHEVSIIEANINTSSGLRLNFYMNSLRLFAEHPLLGVGAGDYPAEYDRINARHTPEAFTTTNPHNQYLFVLSTTGALGGIVLALVLLPPTLWRRQDPELDGLRLALLVFIGAICLLESYLWRSNTSLLYVIFAVVLHGHGSRPPFTAMNAHFQPRHGASH